MVTMKEIKSTMAVAIAGAFGFIIALIWNDIIIGAVTLTTHEIQNIIRIGGIPPCLRML